MRTACLLLALAATGCQDLDIESFGATTNRIVGGAPLATETDTVTIVAAVDVQNGADTDLGGGTLTDAAGNTYGGFEASSTGSTFEVTLSFEQINQVAPITFASPGGSRTFIATFYDDIQDTLTRELTLDLGCRGSNGQLAGACNGVCQDTPSDTMTCVP
jgi:hypothetical protein|nr:hypothetical protein [Kofleriaceae bacterium]